MCPPDAYERLDRIESLTAKQKVEFRGLVNELISGVSRRAPDAKVLEIEIERGRQRVTRLVDGPMRARRKSYEERVQDLPVSQEVKDQILGGKGPKPRILKSSILEVAKQYPIAQLPAKEQKQLLEDLSDNAGATSILNALDVAFLELDKGDPTANSINRWYDGIRFLLSKLISRFGISAEAKALLDAARLNKLATLAGELEKILGDMS